MRWRSAGYWLATAVLVTELALGGVWDIARIPSVRNLTEHLGYPSYFFVLLGTWKVLGEVPVLGILTAVTVLSWALRPPSRRTPRRTSTAPLAGLQVIPASHRSEAKDDGQSRPERRRIRAAVHHGR